MDRSFLTDAGVVAASRDFVCIRLATYEDEQEADYMKTLFTARSGELENTTFAILASDGKRKLAAAGRGPFHAYRDARSMAAGMRQIARDNDSRKTAASPHAQLPLMKSLDGALNVAAADGLPLIVTVGENKKQLGAINQRIVPVAWDESLAGQFVYASVDDWGELKPILGLKQKTGIFAVEPDQFGLSGKLLAAFAPETTPEEIRSGLLKVVAEYPAKEKDHNAHVRLGIQLGIEWESKIPETDPMSLRARQRARGDGQKE